MALHMFKDQGGGGRGGRAGNHAWNINIAYDIEYSELGSMSDCGKHRSGGCLESCKPYFSSKKPGIIQCFQAIAKPIRKARLSFY